ncbi:hypothetical protein [Pedobacter sp. WC2423]|uniref:hypothetical protein n=1 Tax=Pedobacter sp. WC2423 TaxID=3234142 RepID=UPI0034650A07
MGKRKRITGTDTDKAMAKAGSSKPDKPKTGRLKTQEPLAEKDEVKQAEENIRKRVNPDQKKN